MFASMLFVFIRGEVYVCRNTEIHFYYLKRHYATKFIALNTTLFKK